ncbi:MAG: hypothetical protein J7K95_02495 [Thermoplasmata archaeon]|nr:hypothetical protein [Thermoplasmata archaeon]
MRENKRKIDNYKKQLSIYSKMEEKIAKISSSLLLIAIILVILSCILPWKTLFIRYEDEENGEVYFYEYNFLVWGIHIISPSFYSIGGTIHNMSYGEGWRFYWNLRPTQIILGPEYSYTIDARTGEIIDKKANYPHSLLINDFFILLSFPLLILSIIVGTAAVNEVSKTKIKENKNSPVAWIFGAGFLIILSVFLFWFGFKNITKYAQPIFSENLKWSYGIIFPILSVILFLAVSLIMFSSHNSKNSK